MREDLELSTDPHHANQQLSEVLSIDKPVTKLPAQQQPSSSSAKTQSTSGEPVKAPGSGYKGSGKPVPKWFKMK